MTENPKDSMRHEAKRHRDRIDLVDGDADRAADLAGAADAGFGVILVSARMSDSLAAPSTHSGASASPASGMRPRST